jgi:hypothetical protein
MITVTEEAKNKILELKSKEGKNEMYTAGSLIR